MNTYLTRYNSGYTAYVYDARTGYLVANNVEAPIVNNGHFISANSSSNPVIAASAAYIQANGLSENITSTCVPYNATFNMDIEANYFKDSTQTLLLYIVNVDLSPALIIADDDAAKNYPTVMPTQQPAIVVSSSNTGDDDSVTASKNAAIAASVLAAILIILVSVLIFFQVSANAANKA